MEKPPLDKIIEKLEKLDDNQWEWQDGAYFGSQFTAKVGGLIFYMAKERKCPYLLIKDWGQNLMAEYYSKTKDSSKGINRFYNNLYERLKAQRTEEFSKLLDEFLLENIDYKVSMKKPELGKVIAKLEQLDQRRWEMYNGYYGLSFYLEANGLRFCLGINRDCCSLKFNPPYYHELMIKNREGSIKIDYANSKRNSFEEVEITRLYEKIRCALEKDLHTRFTELISTFLSE